MLLFQDGSTHRWIGALDHDLDLVVTLDDANGAIYSALLVAQEGTMSSFLGLCRDDRRARPVRCVVYRPRLALLPDAKGWGQGCQDAADAGRSGAGTARHPSHPLVFAGRARADGAGVRHSAAASAAGAAPGWGEHDGGGEWVSARRCSCRTTTPASASRRRSQERHEALCRPAAGRRAVRAGGAPGRSRQLRAMGQARAADPAAAASPSLRQGDGASARISRRRLAILDGPRCLARYDPAGTLLAEQAAQRAA